ncbi:uncharacterized protein LOC128732413 [Sabethes cyaneus]|uniref:uncharacterized protein LOC128732413 n=1 Tax=Sabethes cyaneus TaxID=53552 RepID=UPI00237DD19E|nr:uncharacterized protein LOC128732413 [Sabethes cyaneus]
MKAIIDGLFPQHETMPWPSPLNGEEAEHVEEARVTNEELIELAKAMKGKKAPGPDGIPNLALKVAIMENLDMFRTTLQKCVDEGNFPDTWKRQKLVLLSKPGKPSGDPLAYRPICLLDTVGKLLERVIQTVVCGLSHNSKQAMPNLSVFSFANFCKQQTSREPRGMAQEPTSKQNSLQLEGDILRSHEEQIQLHLSVESAVENTRNRLEAQIGESGDNMFSLLMRLVKRLLLADKSADAVDRFEEYCRLVKEEQFLLPEHTLREVKPDADRYRRAAFSREIIRQLRLPRQTDGNFVTTVQPGIVQQAVFWSQIGYALPPSVDYFIERQMGCIRTDQSKPFRRVNFWGVVYTLGGSYYVIQLERDGLEACELEYQLSQEKCQIARDVLDGLLRACVSDDSIVSDWCGAESMAADLLEEILQAAIPPNTDEDLATAVAVPVMEAIIQEAVDAAQEPEVELSVMGSLDVVSCSATVEADGSSDLSLDEVKFATAKALLEVKLNVLRYFVCRDPFTGDKWTELPGVDLEKIVASRQVRKYFRGDLEAPTGADGGRLLKQEKDYLRAVLARITMDQRVGRVGCSESGGGLFTDRDVNVFYKATGFSHDWRGKEFPAGQPMPRTIWRKSILWPGSFTYDSEQIYFGWGMENDEE